MSGHTPGPWKAIRNKHYFNIVASDVAGGKTIHEFDPAIASVIANHMYPHTSGADREKANAELMAASPLLLDVLEDIVALPSLDIPAKMLKKAYKAIAKARGQGSR